MRKPKPFFRKFTQSWYVTLKGTQIPLGKNEEQAWQKYHEMMAKQDQIIDGFGTVSELFDGYLDWLEQKRSQATYSKARHYLSLFVTHIGVGMRVATIRGRHVSQWLDTKSWTPTTQNDAASLIQRAFNWAVKFEYLDRSPVAVIEDKPQRQRREVVYSAKEWGEIRSLVTDQPFGDLLDFLWETGCRPIEARTMEKKHLDLEAGLVVFPPSEAKGKRNERVIFLTDAAREICERNLREEGPLLRNTKGRPWTKDAINCRFQRLKKKLDRPLCAYGIRHSYATEGLINGIDSLTLSQLLGHQDTSTISRTYAHLSRNPEYLKKQAQKVRRDTSKENEPPENEDQHG